MRDTERHPNLSVLEYFCTLAQPKDRFLFQRGVCPTSRGGVS
jgi:hypothetical protein